MPLYLKTFLIVATASAFSLVNGKCEKYLTEAKKAAADLQSKYFVPGGTYRDQYVWISAVNDWHLRRLDALTGEKTHEAIINTVYLQDMDHLHSGVSFDDVQWVAIDYMSAGNAGEAKKYYEIAARAKDDVNGYCKGGLWWNGPRDYKNAITNELYMAMSGLMFEKTQEPQYLKELEDIWKWFKSSDMKGKNGLYNDGLTRAGDQAGECKNNQQTQWTYNQGVVLVGLGYLYNFKKDQDALKSAWEIMNAIQLHLIKDGALHESCDSDPQKPCNADQQSFKGILVGYMAWFLSITGMDDGDRYSKFIKQQGDKVLENAKGDDGFYSNVWVQKGAGQFTGPSQGSALGALVAAASQNC